MSACSLILLTAGTILGQDKTEQPKLKGALSSNWGKFGLSDQQKRAIYKIQGDYHDKIAPLKKQNDDQKKLLKEIILKKAGADDKKDEKK
jgi:hypothetical protein